MSSRDAKLAELLEAMQLMTGQSVLLSQTIAAVLGLNSTDLECLGVIMARSTTTAGALAEATGLTTGAITSVIDRLEKAGFIYRDSDPADRRKVLLRPIPERAAKASALFQPLEAAMRKLLSQYDDGQLAFLVDFLRKSTGLAEHQLMMLRAKLTK